jgi:hypothetical protein
MPWYSAKAWKEWKAKNWYQKPGEDATWEEKEWNEYQKLKEEKKKKDKEEEEEKKDADEEMGIIAETKEEMYSRLAMLKKARTEIAVESEAKNAIIAEIKEVEAKLEAIRPLDKRINDARWNLESLNERVERNEAHVLKAQESLATAKKLQGEAKVELESLEKESKEAEGEEEPEDEVLMNDLFTLIKGKADKSDKKRMDVIYQLMEALRAEHEDPPNGREKGAATQATPARRRSSSPLAGNAAEKTEYYDLTPQRPKTPARVNTAHPVPRGAKTPVASSTINSSDEENSQGGRESKKERKARKRREQRARKAATEERPRSRSPRQEEPRPEE